MNISNHQSVPKQTTETRKVLLEKTAERMGDIFVGNQILGRLQTIGCVAVEITQKCNLDCTLCYLSEHSQQVKDIPIEEVFRRLDQVLLHYGEGTHVQITGGDPTLRKHSELVEIIRYANNLGLYTALFTNGIAASRSLLERLAAVGLRDVAFHVDTTQRRAEGHSEEHLNPIREEYLERTKGLGLMVIFNTTVHKDNFHEIPGLVKFFRERASQVGLVSFQLQADTGRGEWRQRDLVIDQATVSQQVEQGSTADLPWDAVQVGHSECHFYLPTLVVNNTVYPVVLDKRFFADFARDFQHVNWNRHDSNLTIFFDFIRALVKQPKWWWRMTKHAAKLLKNMWRDLLVAKGRIEKMTIFVQNFMDATQLKQERIDACSFMVMTAEGPVSMCQHNASRDDYILKPLDIQRADGSTLQYQPLKDDSTIATIPIQVQTDMNSKRVGASNSVL